MNTVIFDFDGTIADSFDEVMTFLCAEAKRDQNSISAEEQQMLRGLSMRQLALKLGVPRWHLPLTYVRGKSKLSRRMHKVQPFAGMPEVIRALHNDNYKMFIISSNNRRNINRFLIEHGLSSYFSAIYGNVGWFGKGTSLKRALRRHKLNADQTTYVGDENRDVIAATIAGMPSIAVSWGFGTEASLLKHSPTILVRQPAELQKILIEWGRTN